MPMPLYEWLAYGCLTALIFDVVWWVTNTRAQKRNYKPEDLTAMVVIMTVVLIVLGAIGFLAMLITVPIWVLFFILKKLDQVRATRHSRFHQKAD